MKKKLQLKNVLRIETTQQEIAKMYFYLKKKILKVMDQVVLMRVLIAKAITKFLRLINHNLIKLAKKINIRKLVLKKDLLEIQLKKAVKKTVNPLKLLMSKFLNKINI